MRQPRNYGAIRETEQQFEDEPATPGAEADAARQPRHYGGLRDTQHAVDAQRAASVDGAEQLQEGPQPPEILRRWTHHGGMVPQQESANEWLRQNYEARMAESEKSEPAPDAEAAPSAQQEQEDAAELAEARAAAEDTRRRLAERAQQQEHLRDRGLER